jgi:hypothetical protein
MMQEAKIERQKPKYQKPLLIFCGLIIVLGSLSLIGLLAFSLGKSRQSVSLITPTPTAETSPQEEALPETATETAIQATPEVSPSPGLSVSPTPNPSASPTPTPTGGTFRWVGPLRQLFKPSETQTLGAAASLDGFRASNLGGNNNIEIRAGRNNALIYRGFVSFDLTALPNDITVEKAVLKIYQAQIVGNPYGIGGNLVVDHLDYGTSLDSSDYNRTATASNIGVLADNATLGMKELEVTERVKNDLSSSRTHSQYRLRFATETVGGSPSGDIAYFESQENTLHTGNLPQLVVTFKRN